MLGDSLAFLPHEAIQMCRLFTLIFLGPHSYFDRICVPILSMCREFSLNFSVHDLNLTFARLDAAVNENAPQVIGNYRLGKVKQPSHRHHAMQPLPFVCV
jgi:hypothetical protein